MTTTKDVGISAKINSPTHDSTNMDLHLQTCKMKLKNFSYCKVHNENSSSNCDKKMEEKMSQFLYVGATKKTAKRSNI